MLIIREEKHFENDNGKDYADITQIVKDFIGTVYHGICSVYARDTSGSVFVTDDDPDKLDSLFSDSFTNVPASMKRIMFGREITIHITNRSADMAPGERIFCKNFDGKTNHRVVLKQIGDDDGPTVDDFCAW